MDFGVRGIGGEIKLFPPPTYHGELDKWDNWSWQLKRYVGLYKPLAKTLMDEIERNAQRLSLMDCVRHMTCSGRARRTINCRCLLNNWHTCWHRSLMELRERLSGMKTQRMALRFGVGCTPSSHCLRELVPRIS